MRSPLVIACSVSPSPLLFNQGEMCDGRTAKYSTTEKTASKYLIFSRIGSDKHILSPSPFPSILRHCPSFPVSTQRHCCMSLISLQHTTKSSESRAKHCWKGNRSPARDRGLVAPDLARHVSASSKPPRHHLLTWSSASTREASSRTTEAIASHSTTQ